ncbi:MAG: glycine cleavage system protein GcvH [Oligoflexia bacterium]|nr:glycine cleavage system protein GcvH [Oligoflexia bacterium]
MSVKIPENLKYTKDHEWVSLDGDCYTMGISDYAQGQLGDIVFVELPAIGTKLTKGKALGVVESIKSVSDVYAPISGEVVEVNSEVSAHPEMCNSDAYSAWFIKVRIANKGEIAELMDAGSYAQCCN